MAATVQTTIFDTFEDMVNKVFGIHFSDVQPAEENTPDKPAEENTPDKPVEKNYCKLKNHDCEVPTQQGSDAADDNEPKKCDATAKEQLNELLFTRGYLLDLNLTEIILLRQALRHIPKHYVNGIRQAIEAGKPLKVLTDTMIFAEYAVETACDLDKRLAAYSECALAESKELVNPYPDCNEEANAIAKNFV